MKYIIVIFILFSQTYAKDGSFSNFFSHTIESVEKAKDNVLNAISSKIEELKTPDNNTSLKIEEQKEVKEAKIEALSLISLAIYEVEVSPNNKREETINNSLKEIKEALELIETARANAWELLKAGKVVIPKEIKEADKVLETVETPFYYFEPLLTKEQKAKIEDIKTSAQKEIEELEKKIKALKEKTVSKIKEEINLNESNSTINDSNSSI